MGRLLQHPLAPLWFYSALLACIFAGYVVSQATPSAEFQLLETFFWGVFLAWWVVADAQRGRRVPCFDFGMFAYLAIPWSVVWYCFWSRGWRGIVMLLCLIGLLFLPYLCATVVAAYLAVAV